jgi:hypothetical protein
MFNILSCGNLLKKKLRIHGKLQISNLLSDLLQFCFTSTLVVMTCLQNEKMLSLINITPGSCESWLWFMRFVMQIGMLEDLRQRTLHGIIGIQKVYKGHKVRCYYRQLRSASVVLQSGRAFLDTFYYSLVHFFELSMDVVDILDSFFSVYL